MMVEIEILPNNSEEVSIQRRPTDIVRLSLSLSTLSLVYLSLSLSISINHSLSRVE